MKKYRLKKWYPGLPVEWKDEEVIVESDGNRVVYPADMPVGRWVAQYHVQDNPEYWEEVDDDKPVFSRNDLRAIIKQEEFVYLTKRMIFVSDIEKHFDL